MSKVFPLYLSLIHYPVINKKKETVTTSVTLFDLHDIARSCVTFGVTTFFVVNHAPKQHQVVQRVIDFWNTGYGKEYNANRKEALDIVETTRYWEDSRDIITETTGIKPIVIGTSAHQYPSQQIAMARMQEIRTESPILLLFGTGWGLSPEIIQSVDHMLEPISGPTLYNHLSVRSAVAIILHELTNDFDLT